MNQSRMSGVESTGFSTSSLSINDKEHDESLDETCLDQLLQPTKYVDTAFAELKQPLNSTTDDDEDTFSDSSFKSLVWVPRDAQDAKTREVDFESGHKNLRQSEKLCLTSIGVRHSFALSHRNENDLNGATGHKSQVNGDVGLEIKPTSTLTTSLTINHVSYVVKENLGSWWNRVCFKKTRKKRVLHDIAMHLTSGQITAILGNSGSGKTSLLDVITGRATGVVSGEVLYNNDVCTHDVIKKHTAYVMQADRLLQNLTVRETLRYSARLKLPGDMSTTDIEEKVTSVIMQMGLKDVADSRIGSGIVRGVSGGEQRRVTIAIHLLKNPDLILLDEPTSGLDSYTARYLVSNLRDLARRGKIVLLTIHQPSSDLFKFFDQIAIMSVGEMVYYVDVASVDRRDKKREQLSLERVRTLVQAFRASTIFLSTEGALQKLSHHDPSIHHRKEKIKAPSFLRVLTTIVGRMMRNVFRERRDYMARLLLLPMFMVFILLFLGRLKFTQSSVHDRTGLLYQSCAVPTFIGVINSVALFPCLRDVYYRETVDGLYGPGTFLLAYTIHIIPFTLFSTFLFSSLLYWVTGLQPDVFRFGSYYLTALLVHYSGEMISVASLSIFLNPNLTTSLMSAFQSSALIISSGFIKNVHTLPKPLEWLSWAFIFRYSGEVYVANEFSGLELECPANMTMTCMHKGEQFIEHLYPGAVENIGRNFVAMAACALGSLVLAVLVFKLVGPKTLH